MDILQNIDSLKEKIDQLRPISQDLEKQIMQKFRLDWNFHSNNIEGNTLTFGETKTFLLHGITAKGKPLKDHLDIKGHNEALLMLEDIVKKETEITQKFIRELHIIILHESYFMKSKTPDGKIVPRKIEVGKYKTQPNHVLTETGEMHYFASPEETAAKMHDLIEWYREVRKDLKGNKKSNYHPLLIASIFHYKFIAIHPFDDGNGRLARILMNLILMQYGYPPVIIKTKEKEDYYTALKEADGGNKDYFVKYIAEQLINSLELYLKGASGEDIEDETDIDKEIELLKASLKGEKEKLTITKKQSREIYYNNIKPILLKVFKKLEKFDELFFEKEITCWSFGDALIVNNKEGFFKVFEERFDSVEMVVGTIGFEYKWKEFKKTESLNFDCYTSLFFTYEKYNYLKIYSKQSVFKDIFVPYKNPKISNDSIILITNSLAKNILNQISEHIKDDKIVN
ncbi:MAG: Fic family protein [Bacteroidota bacterium]|nr:Fic family protein [Bacteroidota bacterium]